MRKPVNFFCESYQFGVKPSAPARPSGSCSKFVSRLSQFFSYFVQEFGGKGAFSHAGGVCLGDAKNGRKGACGNTCSVSDSSGYGGRCRYKRIRPPVIVQKCSLCPLKQYMPFFSKRFMKQRIGFLYKRLYFLSQ